MVFMAMGRVGWHFELIFQAKAPSWKWQWLCTAGQSGPATAFGSGLLLPTARWGAPERSGCREGRGPPPWQPEMRDTRVG